MAIVRSLAPSCCRHTEPGNSTGPYRKRLLKVSEKACRVWVQHTEAQQGATIDLIAIRSPCSTSLAHICHSYRSYSHIFDGFYMLLLT